MTLCSLQLSSDLNESFPAFFMFQQMQSLLLLKNYCSLYPASTWQNLNICNVFTVTF